MIEQALRAVEKRDEALAKLHTDPVALVGQAIAQMKGCENAQTGWFSPLEARREREEAARFFDPETADMLLELTRESKLPPWTIEVLNLDLIRKAASRNATGED